MSHSGGRVVVGLVGAAVAVVGATLVVEGVTRKFEKYLELSRMSPAVRRLVGVVGVAGTVARGAVFALAGVFVIQAAWDYQPSKAAGLDGALRSLRDTRVGPWLLGAVALGLVAFGLYGFAEARWRRSVSRRAVLLRSGPRGGSTAMHRSVDRWSGRRRLRHRHDAPGDLPDSPARRHRPGPADPSHRAPHDGEPLLRQLSGHLGRGDGLSDPPPHNLNLAGEAVTAFQLSKPAQPEGVPSQSWEASHLQYGSGANDGFVSAIEKLAPDADASLAMGHWTKRICLSTRAWPARFPSPSDGSRRASGRPSPIVAS